MFDEFRLVNRDLHDTARQAALAGMDPTVTAPEVALLQGLIVSHPCRSVVETNFGIGQVAAATGAAFRRLQPGAARPQYIGVSSAPDGARYIYTYLKRKYTHWMPSVQIRLGTPTTAFGTLGAGTFDLGIVHGRPRWGETQVDWMAARRVVRSAGLILVRLGAKAERPSAEWMTAHRVVALASGVLLLHGNGEAG